MTLRSFLALRAPLQSRTVIDTLALTNGKIWTREGFAQSLLMRDGRIAALDVVIPPGTRTIDVGGRLVIPGFIDSHLHFVTGSRQVHDVQLRDAATLQAFSERIAARAAMLGAGAWITGGGWDEQRWSPPSLPTKQSIDAATSENPVFATRLDLHMGLANSRALALAGINRETEDPVGGTIVRDANGEPTGILKDAAMRLVTKVVPPLTVSERVAAARDGLREAARHGVTAFCDMGMAAEAFDDLRAYQRLERAGELTARVWMYLPIAEWQRLAVSGIEKGFGSAKLRVAGVKGFADGSLGSSTAAFLDSYEGEEGNRGLLMAGVLDGSLSRSIKEADLAELQPAIHAIGDDANEKVLSMFEAHTAHRERRFRIEHAQHLNGNLIQRFAKARVIASMQPYHLSDDGRWAESKIGSARAQWAFPIRSLLDAGAMVSFGSDWPVAPLDPLAGIHAAVTRRTFDGAHPSGWVASEKVTVAEALRCYTARSAWAVFAETEIGTIASRMRADLAVLSEDIFTIAPEEIERVRVDMTIFDGHVIYER
jgi:predicted amidohydrolase YtcJ